MKKLALILSISASSMLAYAQNGNNICVFNSLTYYADGGGADELERGKKCSDEAIVNPETAGVSKTWWYRMQLYSNIISDKVAGPKYPDAALEAVTCVKKLAEINDPKFKDWDEVNKYSQSIAVNTYNSALDAYKANDFATAYKKFNAVWELNVALSAKGKKVESLDPYAAANNAGLAAEQSGNNDGAIVLYKTLVEKKPEPKYYRILSAFYRKIGKKDESVKTIDEGLAKFPGDVDLLKEKIDAYISEGKEGEAIDMLNKAISIDTKNDKLYYALGVAYSKVGKEKEAMDAYNQSVALNPKSFDAYYNMGVMVFNRAGKITEEMNKVGNTKEELAKYEVLKKKRTEAFLEAKPYFLKAKEISPDDQLNLKALKQIDLYTAE
jgi:predicted Zn-dependent protease